MNCPACQLDPCACIPVGSEQENKNRLSGMSCPHCGSLEPFMIWGTALFEVFDDGTDAKMNCTWNYADRCTCKQCGYAATVAHFTVDQKAHQKEKIAHEAKK